MHRVHHVAVLGALMMVCFAAPSDGSAGGGKAPPPDKSPPPDQPFEKVHSADDFKPVATLATLDSSGLEATHKQLAEIAEQRQATMEAGHGQVFSPDRIDDLRVPTSGMRMVSETVHPASAASSMESPVPAPEFGSGLRRPGNLKDAVGLGQRATVSDGQVLQPPMEHAPNAIVCDPYGSKAGLVDEHGVRRFQPTTAEHLRVNKDAYAREGVDGELEDA